MTNGDEPIVEDKVQIEDCKIGYQRYGHGPENFIFICGGVGKSFRDFDISNLTFTKTLFRLLQKRLS
jgi:hypothetical protein